jgi:predicted NACHT family NTPase
MALKKNYAKNEKTHLLACKQDTRSNVKRNVGKIKELTLFLYAEGYYCVSLHNMSILYRGSIARDKPHCMYGKAS